jgi:REP element-mobilizing transposase RayT
MTLFKNRYRSESARLRGWDYRNAGYYFVTICTHQREHFFGKVMGRSMDLSPLGEIAAQFWAEIPSHHSGIELDEWIVMPNHVHGIVVIREHAVVSAGTLHPVGTLRATSLPDANAKMSEISPKAGSLSVVIRSYKSAVTRWAGLNGYKDFAWQPRFYDHIVRDETSLHNMQGVYCRESCTMGDRQGKYVGSSYVNLPPDA